MTAVDPDPRNRLGGRLALMADAIALIGPTLIDNPVKHDPWWMRALAYPIRLATRSKP